jgi:hypothetical protein
MSDQETPQQEEPTPAWQWFLYSAGCIGLAILVFFLLKNMEESGQGGRMNWIIVILYKIGGKWTAAGVLGGLGVLFAVLGLMELGKSRGASEDEDDSDRPRRKRRPRAAEDSEEDDEDSARQPRKPPRRPADEDDAENERPERRQPRRRETED